jgi:hypothetical protein
MKHLALNRDGAVSVSAREIAEQYDIPIELMAKVLQRPGPQRAAGVYAGHARRLHAAPAGGVDQRVRRHPGIDGPFSVTACSTENNGCDQYSKCSVRDPLWQIRERIAAALATVSVAELAADQIKGEGLRPDAETVPAPVAIMRRARVAADL